jgi:prevent-host-death family protein
MVRTIAQRELRNENAKIMDAVTAGETFVVTRNGEPVAELRPVQSDRKTFISRDDLTRISAAGVRIDPGQFRRDLDDAIDQRL